MRSAFPAKLSRLGINLFFLYLSLSTLVMGVLMSRLSRRWIVSDWLINYEGGFVRRGLAGELAYLLGHFLHISPIFFVTIFYLSFILTFLLAVRSLALSSSLNFWVLALLINPATFSFQLLHPTAGFRKEIIFLACFALFVVLLRRNKLSPLGVSLYLTPWILFGILSHEAFTFYLPYFFAALLLNGRSFVQAMKQFALPAVAALAAFYECSTHLGTRDTAMRICSSLGYKFIVPGSLEVCSGGAIPYLMRSREFARAEAVAAIHNYHFLVIFPIFALLALLPTLGESLTLIQAGFKRQVAIVWIFVLLSFLGTLGLFYYGIDWGRWIYVHVCSITVLLLMIDGAAKRRARLDRAESPNSSVQTRFVLLGLLFLYGTCWLMPNTYETLHWGYLERVGRVLHVWPKSATPEVDASNPT